MICPGCGHDNIEGVELCIHCGGNLAGLDLPASTTRLQRRIMEAPLKNLNPAPPLIVSPETSIENAVRQMKDRRYGCIFVVESGKLVGIITEHEILHKLALKNIDLKNLKALDIMAANPETLTENDRVAFALNRMSVGDYRHIPVMRGEELIGLVSVRGILKHISDHLL